MSQTTFLKVQSLPTTDLTFLIRQHPNSILADKCLLLDCRYRFKSYRRKEISDRYAFRRRKEIQVNLLTIDINVAVSSLKNLLLYRSLSEMDGGNECVVIRFKSLEGEVQKI